jgi:putative tryptophan/tyrosine transport system substrate-binding protein
MNRRDFIAGLGGAAAAWPLAAPGQELPTIGWLYFTSPDAQREYRTAFYRGLAETGYIEGRNVVIDERSAENRVESRAALAADLVRRQVSVIVTDTTLFAVDAKAATQTIPIVFMVGGDPVQFGLVSSINHPGGNATGVYLLGPDVTSKRLELLHKLIPVQTIAILVGRDNNYARAETKDVQLAAHALGIGVLVVNIVADSEIEAAFASFAARQVGAVLMSSNILFQNARHQIISLAAHYAVPTMFWDSASAEAGGVLSYGPDFFEIHRQAGRYVGRILKGEKPADLPVQQPTKFELVINLHTAKALGLTIPPNLLAVADEVIE